LPGSIPHISINLPAAGRILTLVPTSEKATGWESIEPSLSSADRVGYGEQKDHPPLLKDDPMRFAAIGMMFLLVTTARPPVVSALTPGEVAVIYRKDDRTSAELARFYMKARNVPAENALGVECGTYSFMSRQAFNEQLREPIRKWLTDSGLKDRIRCLLMMHPIAYRALGSKPPAPMQAYLDKAAQSRQEHLKRLSELTWGLDQLAAGRLPGNPPAPKGKLNARNTLKRARAASSKVVAAVGRIAPANKPRALSMLYRIWQEMYGQAGVIELAGRAGGPPVPAGVDVNQLARKVRAARAELAKLKGDDLTTEQWLHALELTAQIDGLAGRLQRIGKHLKRSENASERASVDSELMMLWHDDYRLRGNLPNPLNWRRDRLVKPDDPPTLMVCRLDGNNLKRLPKLITDAVEAEKAGLRGRVYIDLAGIARFSGYDRHLERTAELITSTTKLPVTVEKTGSLLQPGSAKDCALYLGWYSLRKYVPAFDFNKGAVGYHIASFEIRSLRDPDSKDWVPNLINDGMVGTFGSFDEPYLAAFPSPVDYFGLILTGQYTMAEVYHLTIPHASWHMVYVGDPLYTPFKNNPKLKLKQLEHFRPPRWLGD
jgi:uncharacterized protein (TIGR03790 family)